MTSAIPWMNSSGLGMSFFAGLTSSLTSGISAGSATPTFTRASTAYVLGYDAAAVLGVDDPIMLLCASGEARFMGARRVSEGVWSAVDANGVALTTTNGASSLCCDTYGPFGYLSEGARADVLGATAAIRRTMTDVGWVSGGGGITVGAAVGANGVADEGASLTATGANGTILFTTVLGAAIRTYSAWVRRKTGTGTVNITGDNGTTWTPITLTTAYKQFSFTTASAANPVVGFRIVTDTDAIEVDFNTLEAATFANPTPIPGNVSKAADTLTYVKAGNLSDTLGTAYLEAMTATTGATISFLTSYPGSGGGSYIDNTSGVNLTAFDGTATRTLKAAVTPFATVTKQASAWGGVSMIGAVNGTAGTAQTFDSDMSGGATISVGYNIGTGANHIFGTIRNLRLYQSALPVATLQTITT